MADKTGYVTSTKNGDIVFCREHKPRNKSRPIWQGFLSRMACGICGRRLDGSDEPAWTYAEVDSAVEREMFAYNDREDAVSIQREGRSEER